MSFEHSQGMPLISACTWYDSRTAKSPRPLSLEDEGCICFIRLSWYHHHLPRAGASVGSFLTWRARPSHYNGCVPKPAITRE